MQDRHDYYTSLVGSNIAYSIYMAYPITPVLMTSLRVISPIANVLSCNGAYAALLKK